MNPFFYSSPKHSSGQTSAGQGSPQTPENVQVTSTVSHVPYPSPGYYSNVHQAPPFVTQPSQYYFESPIYEMQYKYVPYQQYHIPQQYPRSEVNHKKPDLINRNNLHFSQPSQDQLPMALHASSSHTSGQDSRQSQPDHQQRSQPHSHKRHRKSKSFPDKHYAQMFPSKSMSNKKSHNAEAPSSENVKFPIIPMPQTTKVSSSIDLQSLYSKIEVKKYSTSAIDPVRNYLTVYEYPINKHWVVWDYETGFVHLTGIWKASLECSSSHSSGSSAPGSSSSTGHSGGDSGDHPLPKSHSKADIVKLLETTPKQYQQHIKRIRGGFLKIQGTWLPYYLCKIVARKFCYHIRFELIPIFGPEFPDSCLTPEDPGFGKLRLDECHGELSKSKKPNSLLKRKLDDELKLEKGLNDEFATKKLPKIATESFGDRKEQFGGVLVREKEKDEVESSEAEADEDQEPEEVEEYDQRNYSSNSTGAPPTLGLFTTTNNIRNLNPAETTATLTNDPSLTYHEMLDIVTASKCLQSLKQPSSSTSPTSVSVSPNFSLAPDMQSVCVNGISSILEAAGLKENPPKRRRSLKIHELIS
ncbi:hypothetical protein CAAN3_08S03884 [[Candida] anglica]